MKGYIMSIAGVILLSAVVSVLVPEGKLGTFVRGMTKLLIVAVIAAPLVNAFKEKNFDFASPTIVIDESYLDKSGSMLEERDRALIAEYLEKEFSVAGEIEVERDREGIFAIRKIRVKITDFGLIGQEEHIDKLTRIREELTARFGCETEVYEG